MKAQRTEPPRLLVIDDERRMAESLKSLLEGTGYRADVAFDGNEAAERIRSNRYDLIVSDIKLPFKDGLELLRLAKELDPDTVVIFMTGYATLESAVDAIGQGAYDYLLKPVEFSHLRLAVDRGLDKRFSNEARNRLLHRLRQTNTLLRRRIKEINALYQAGRSLSTTLEIQDLLSKIVHLAAEVIGARTGSIMLLDPERNSLEISAAIGLDPRIITETSIPLGSSIAGVVAQSGKPVIIEDIETDSEFKRKAKDHYESKSFLSVPVVVKGEILGVINLTDKLTAAKFTKQDLKILTTFASQAAVAIDDARHYEEARRKLKEFVALYEIASELSNLESFPQMARLIHFHIKNLMPVQFTLWLFYDAPESLLGFSHWEGWGSEHFDALVDARIPIPAELVEDTSESARIILEFLNHNLHLEGQVRAFRALPIYTQDTLYGLFCIGSLEADSFNRDHEYLASIITSQAASVYERQRAILNATRLLTMGNMMSEISHDLKKPLTNIKGGLQILRERWPEITSQDSFFDMAEQELSRLTELVRELVDFSNPRKYQTEKRRMEEVIQRALKLIANDLERSRISLEVDLEPALPPVDVNYNEITEALLNIAINAVDAMPEGGKLSVRAHRAVDPKTGHAFVEIEITDTGKGIEPENLIKVFDRYFTTKETGTGLGLAVVERIVKAHHGKVEVKSKLGKGSTFTVSLPAQ